MNCTKCGKKISDGEKKICNDCQKKLLEELDHEDVITESKTEISEENKETEKKKKNVFVKVILAIIIVVLAIGVYVVLDDTIPNSVGNSIANIRNYGYTAEQGSWIYYVAPSEDGTAISIYKSKKDGTQKQELAKDTWDVLGLNVVGSYMYFIGISDEAVEKSTTLESNEESLDTLNNKIYRMKLDGTELEVINSNEFHNNCYEIYVIEDKIYYIGVDTNIYYMNLDGSNKTRLNDDETGFLGITEDYIILNLEKKNEEKPQETAETSTTSYETYIMNIDGTEKKSLTGNRLYSINIVDEYIFYVDSNKAIYKVKVDGTENTLISDKVTAYNMNVTNEKIYYMSYMSEQQDKIAIYTMNLDGSDNKMIYELDNYSSFLNTIDDNIVFMDGNEKSATINMVNSEGIDKIILYELKYVEESNENTEISNETNSQNLTTENTTSTENIEVKQ